MWNEVVIKHQTGKGVWPHNVPTVWWGNDMLVNPGLVTLMDTVSWTNQTKNKEAVLFHNVLRLFTVQSVTELLTSGKLEKKAQSCRISSNSSWSVTKQDVLKLHSYYKQCFRIIFYSGKWWNLQCDITVNKDFTRGEFILFMQN